MELLTLMCYSSSTMLHIVGFVILCRRRLQAPSQRLLLMNLSAAEALNSLSMLLQKVESINSVIPSFICDTSAIMVTLLVVLIIINCHLNYKLGMNYTRIFDQFTVVKSIGGLWAGFATVILLLTLHEKSQFLKTFTILGYLLDAIILFLVASSLLQLCIMIRVSRKKNKKLQIQSRKRLEFRVSLFIPIYITITYVLFHISGSALHFLAILNSDADVDKIDHIKSHILFSLGYISHAFIYLFLQSNIKCKTMMWIFNKIMFCKISCCGLCNMLQRMSTNHCNDDRISELFTEERISIEKQDVPSLKDICENSLPPPSSVGDPSVGDSIKISFASSPGSISLEHPCTSSSSENHKKRDYDSDEGMSSEDAGSVSTAPSNKVSQLSELEEDLILPSRVVPREETALLFEVLGCSYTKVESEDGSNHSGLKMESQF